MTLRFVGGYPRLSGGGHDGDRSGTQHRERERAGMCAPGLEHHGALLLSMDVQRRPPPPHLRDATTRSMGDGWVFTPCHVSRKAFRSQPGSDRGQMRMGSGRSRARTGDLLLVRQAL